MAKQVLWASFDRLELGPSSFKHVLLLGYSNGFQVIDVEDASDVIEVVSKRDDPVTFLQMQPLPAKSEGREGFRASHPLLLVVSCAESKSSGPMLSGRDGLVRDGYNEPPVGNLSISPTTVRFYSLRSHNYVHYLRFRSTVFMVRCSPHIVAVGLQHNVLTYPVPQLGGQGTNGVNIGYGPMAVGPRCPSTSPGSGSLMARYAMESSKQIATGLINLGDMGYKTLSRYCQDLIPDGSSSPVYSNSSWKVGRGATHSAETDNAGMVVVKDFVSKAVVSQFRAHTSPISALCFDPSGTLLVTASVHGNNINIFRIMPSSSRSASGTKIYDWSSSHVHLYKLHRGITSAVIQDICFSHYSQWIAIVSSRGTCHIFVLSPFGGENVLQIHNSHVDGPSLLPVLSLPWWSTPSFMQCCIFSSRKDSVPSGAIAAVFHSCVARDLQPSHLKNVNALDHLLVYTPCGHLVQYKLLSSGGGESSEVSSRIGQGSSVQIQNEELRVNVESVQWWDVCRRADWSEREECISGITLGRQETTNTSMETSDCEDNDSEHVESLKSHDPSHLYLSNAEVQMSSWRMPLWQKSKMYFCEINHLEAAEQNVIGDHAGGEIEVEKVPIQEVEIRRKDLLPVFDHFHRTFSTWNHRGHSSERYSPSSAGSQEVKDSEDAVISHSESVSSGSVANSDGGSSTKFYPLILQSSNNTVSKGEISVSALPIQYKSSINQDSNSISFEQSQMGISPEDSNSMDSNVASVTNGFPSAGRTIAKIQSSNSVVTSEASNTSSNRSDLSMNIIDEGPTNDSLDFEQFFQEGYCKVSSLSEFHESAEVSFVDNNISPGDLEKSEEDGDNDDMLGGVFAFSEEG
ncbi:hypothetical protein GH714_003393 [Hevea brasiliensis]|uniref:Uncharacterized protein n=1 Tax=Hevea brasiliensis TaxID=3981 RepID=A0A6A6KIQ0_HEVBR|nr:hypothetical protein GH714_003393 [Hevea brasiliensis]